MSDEDYSKKLETLQQYIPFLDNMIQQLKDPTKKNREQQLTKMQSLHAMITDKKKKLKLETLVRCEDVISKLYEKVHNRPIGIGRKNDSPTLTPISPSPPRDIGTSKPLTIPTERLDGNRHIARIDVYSSAAESLNRPRSHSGLSLSGRVPDMSKPPISLEDLKTLEDDVQDKINESALKSASLNELNSLREMISEQIELEDIKASPQKTKKEGVGNINTTVRNNLNLTKKTIQPPDKSSIKSKIVQTAPATSTTPKNKDPKSEASPEINKETKTTPSLLNAKPKILKEPASIFGSILSNIDGQILGGKKRRNSLPGKEERRLSDGGKEKPAKTGDKALEKKKEEKRSSSCGKSEEKKTGDSKKRPEKIQTVEPKGTDKSVCLTGKQTFVEMEQKLKDKLDKFLEDAKNASSSKDCLENKDATKDNTFTCKISVKKDLELKPIKEMENKDNTPGKISTFKRLADKYNPKPKKQSLDADVDKAVTDSIEENMKHSPPKIPVINQLPEPVPPPASLLICSKAEPEQPPQPIVPLPAVLQNILNPSTTHLINSVVNHLRQTNAENEARKSPLLSNPPLIPNPPAPLMAANHGLMSPPTREDNFISEYCRDVFNTDDNINNQMQSQPPNNQFIQPARSESRMRFEHPTPQEMMGNQFGQSPRYIPPLLGERFNDGFPNRQYPGHPSMPDMYGQPFVFAPANQIDLQPLDYYPPNAPLPANQYNSGPPLLSPEIPHYHNEQKPGTGFPMMMNNEFFCQNDEGGHWRNEDTRYHWSRDQDMRINNRDPRTYREYRELREARDPRAVREMARDPRVNRDPRDARLQGDRDYRDPRLLNKARDSRDDRNKSRQRDNRSQSRDYRPSRYDSKFDRMYSRTNRDRSRSRSRPKETFASPLDSLYTGKEEHRTGKGYGVQNFRIPKIKKEDEAKEKEEENAKVTSTNEGLLEAIDSDTEINDAADSDNEDESNSVTKQPESKEDAEKSKTVDETTKEVVLEAPQEASEPAAEVEAKEFESPRIPSQQLESETKPADQTILAQFFANLLGSKNKRDKKTALYSLISTFSDSFNEKELSKITKIIKANDEDDESSEDEEETKKVAQKIEEDKDTVPAIGEVDKEDEVSIKTTKPKARKRIRRISSGSPTKEDKPKAIQNVEPQEEEKVIVSVGERIKSRKRNSASPSKPKKKFKTELDMLHEDIQDMFIRDGVLTASGKRMCRILKGDPTVLAAAQPPNEPEEVAKPRRKPGPKSRQKGHPNAAEVKVMKSVRVVIPKIPDSDAVQKEDSPKRNLRRSVRNVAYAESDDEMPSRAATPTIEVEHVAANESPKKLIESEGEDSSDSEKEKSAHPNESNQKSKIGKRRRGKGWALGNIPSNKKKKKSKISDETDREDAANKNDATDISVANDSDLDRSYIEPDKNYYTDTVTNKSHQCKLCSYHGRFITTHYKTTHPLSEILTSRFSPAIAVEAIKDSEENLLLYESLMRIKGGAKIQFTCRFCEFNTYVPPTMFYDHITTHTGEYRHICPVCEFSASSGKTLKSHMSNAHQNEDKRVARKSYGQTIMFGYMCGECNYVQLSKKNVEEHINIFHLQKPTVYKINMSTYMDPEVEKIAEEELPVTESDDVTTIVEDKDKQEESNREEDVAVVPKAVEVKRMPPPQRKKPGPKPGPKSKKKYEKKPRKKTVRSSLTAEIVDSDDVTTDNESITSKESESMDHVAENRETVPEKPVPRKPPKEISVEEEMYPIGRSRRAAKDKATEKLKTMMEVTESPPRKRSITSDDVKKHEDKCKKEEIKPVEETVLKRQMEEKCNEEEQVVKNQEAKVENVEDPEPITLQHKQEDVEAVVKKEVEMNVFTCKTDLLEENKKIEQERLQLMDELNKSVGSRTSLNFVDKLCNRLNQSNVVVKQEPQDDLTDSLFARELNNDSPLVMPVLQKENHLSTHLPAVAPPPSTVTMSSNKKPVLEPDVTQVTKPSFDVIQKNDKIITDMIQKLKGKLASGIDDKIDASPITVSDTDYESEGPPPLTHVNELVNVKPADGSTKTLLIGGFVRVIKNSDSLMFSCLVPPCVFSTENKDAFQAHCKEAHRQSLLSRPTTLCEMCGMEITPSTECALLENLFKHIIADHADFLANEPQAAFKPPSRVLRIRKLSGDALSVIKSDWDDDSGDSRDNVDDDVVSSAAKADMEENAITPPSETLVAPDDQPATMVELSMSEDNPFPFKISGVMSLAEPNPPPLAPIATKPPPAIQLGSGTQLVVKEAKLTQAEVNKPRKTAKAMAKFIASISDLYKCPHYYCLFSTNFRDFLERHLKAHKVEQDIMIPCVYCDMKTPWEHVPMHIDIRHAHCRFACSYCLYRAVVKEYVFLHQDQAHPAADYSVIVLPQPKHSKRFAIAEVKVDPKTLCEPYKCASPCKAKYLFENEFKRHLQDVHKSNFIQCGYKNCSHKVQAVKMPDHWALRHGVCVYQCGHCKSGASDLIKMYHHFAQAHQGMQPDILIRMVTVLQDGINLGYSMEAFQVLRKVVTIPTNLLEQSKTEETTADPLRALLVPTVSKQYSKSKSASLFAKTPLQKVASGGKKSVIVPANASVANSRSIAYVNSNSNTVANSNILLLPSASRSNSLNTIVMATQSPIVTAMVPVNKSMRALPSSDTELPAPAAMEDVTITAVPKEGELGAAPSEPDNRDAQLTVEPLEHITVCDDNQLVVDEAGDNGDIDPLSLDMDLSDATKATDGNSSGDESDGSRFFLFSADGKAESTKKGSKKGLMSYQLFRCAFCDISFSNSGDFRRHAIMSLTCRNDDATGKQFVCVHCGKKLKNPQILLDHIQVHGVERFSCSLCSNKYPTASQARGHFKTRHNITQTSLTPVNPDKTNIDMDEYVVRPKSVLQPLAASEAAPSEPSANASSADNVYTPDQIDKLPMRHILSSSVRCGLCSYSTKVRTNMVRHLQFHSEEKAVSESAPVNPVPCLEKNEKMFDKMVNLASSSHTGSRMGGAKSEGKEKEAADNLPDFVQTHCRYVCPAHNCNYLCPEEANLRHHIIALHDNETSFTCVHCKTDLSHTEAEHIIKHFKLHGLQLYKCQYCNFISNLRHKVEKHTVDVHPDLPFKIVTVRCLESEPKDQEQSAPADQPPAAAPPSSKPPKPWRCCMCKYKSGTQPGIQQHVLEKHEIDAQIKCALCTYKNDDMENFQEHFKEAHNNQSVDVIYAYRKLEDKEKESEALFDTTPLWQRDRPRVRHIRGILFDESSPVAAKSPKKAAKNAASPGPSGVKTLVPSSPSPSSVKTSLDISIESVANGTADILQAAVASSFTPEDFDTPKDDADEDVVIIIDDEEEKRPLAKNKDNKNAPVAKNRPAKRKGAVDVAGILAKVAKLADEVIDVDGNASDGEHDDEFSERNLRLRFGHFGVPLNRQLKCPVCNQFKSKRISDFIFHLYKEMKVYRFKCKICDDESITFRYMYKHVQEHNAGADCDANIVCMPADRQLEAWLQMVIREQSLIILQNFSPTPDTGVSASGGKIVACRHCHRQYQSEQERNEHSIIHWSLKPFGCSKCKFTAYDSKEIAKHLETHSNPGKLLANLLQNIVSKAPTVAEELKLSDETHMKEMRSSLSVDDQDEEDPLRLPENAATAAPVEIDVAPVAPVANDVALVAPPHGATGDNEKNKDDDAELSENDLFIVTKTDNNVPLETDVYCCEYCPYMTNSETLVLSHITSVHEHMHIKFKMMNRITCERNERDYVGCMLCPEMGSEIRVRQHHLEKHDGQTFLLYRFTCSLCGKKFLKTNGLKMHFKKLHSGFPLKYVGLKGEVPNAAPAPEPAPSLAAPTPARPSPKPHNLRCYKCPLCSYERLFQPNSVSNVRSHLKQHFKAFSCGLCVTLKFKTRWEAMSHFVKEHRGLPENIVQDAKVNDDYNEMMARIVRDAKPVEEKTDSAPPAAPKAKNTARKSTSAPSNRTDEEYSYYGCRPEPIDLAKIMTSVEVNGMSLDMTAEKLSKIFDLEAAVVVEDCNLPVNLSALFDS